MIMQGVEVILFPFFHSFFFCYNSSFGLPVPRWLECFCWQTSARMGDIPRQLLNFEECQHFPMEDFQVLDKAFKKKFWWKLMNLELLD